LIINQFALDGIGPGTDCPGWLAFLEEATGAEYALIDFLQRWCGYCLTGDIRELALCGKTSLPTDQHIS
jgi:phage/plasmid-associated DNA primase